MKCLVVDASDSDDSLSETIVLPHSSDSEHSELEDPFNNRRIRHDVPAIPRKRQSAKAPRPVCPVCKKGFQLGRVPPLHLNCNDCKKPTHKRCTPKSKEGKFVCSTCQTSRANASESLSPQLPSQQSMTNKVVHQSSDQSSLRSSVSEPTFSLPPVERCLFKN